MDRAARYARELEKFSPVGCGIPSWHGRVPFIGTFVTRPHEIKKAVRLHRAGPLTLAAPITGIRRRGTKNRTRKRPGYLKN